MKLLSHIRLFVAPWIIAHGIFQARVLEWVSISFSRGSSWPRDQTQVSRIARRGFTSEPPGKPHYSRVPPEIYLVSSSFRGCDCVCWLRPKIGWKTLSLLCWLKSGLCLPDVGFVLMSHKSSRTLLKLAIYLSSSLISLYQRSLEFKPFW